jgi:hypothetical protein
MIGKMLVKVAQVPLQNVEHNWVALMIIDILAFAEAAAVIANPLMFITPAVNASQ